ncbi:MAG: hypothetical protein ACRDHZ_25385, partial [Ktedonobacteraceae bacterium]
MKTAALIGAFVLIVGACVSNSNADSNLSANPPLSYYVENAKEIAIIRIDHVEPLYAETSRKTTCGAIYHAIVEKSIRGHEKKFSFLSWG